MLRPPGRHMDVPSGRRLKNNYCSALSNAYRNNKPPFFLPPDQWATHGRLILALHPVAALEKY